MKKTTSIKMLSLFLALACCMAMLIIPASAQGGSFEYNITATVSNNTGGGLKDGVTYLSKGAVVTLQFSLPTNTKIASGEVHIEYDPTKYSAAVNPGVVSVANMSPSSIISNPARKYVDIADPSVKDNMSSSSNNIAQFFFSTDNATGDNGGGTICQVIFTVTAETAALSPTNAQSGGFRIVSAMANQDTGTIVGTDIAKNGLNFGINTTTSAYMLANVPKIQLLMFDYDVDGEIGSIDLAAFSKLLTGNAAITQDLLQISDISGEGLINSVDYAALRACMTQGKSSYVYVDIVV